MLKNIPKWEPKLENQISFFFGGVGIFLKTRGTNFDVKYTIDYRPNKSKKFSIFYARFEKKINFGHIFWNWRGHFPRSSIFESAFIWQNNPRPYKIREICKNLHRIRDSDSGLSFLKIRILDTRFD